MSGIEDELVFMQDLSSIHTSRRVTTWFQNNNVARMDDWPPKEMVRSEFYALDDDYMDSLIKSMPKRVGEVISKNGGWTKY